MPRAERQFVLNEVQQEFVTRNAHILVPYCKEAVKRRIIRPCDYEDFYDLLVWCLCRTAYYYNSSRSHDKNELAFIKMVFRQRIGQFKRWRGRKCTIDFLSFETKDMFGNTLEDSLEVNERPVLDKKMLNRLVRQAHLDYRSYNCLVQYYFENKSVMDIGRIFHITRERVRQVLINSVRAIQELVTEQKLQFEDFFVGV